MNSPLPLLIRADAGGALGTGHVMRMIALAQAWQDRGGKVTLASCQCPQPLVTRIQSEDIIPWEIVAEPGSVDDLKQTTRIANDLGAVWVVLDGYHFQESFQLGLRDAGIKVMTVDDCSHCIHWPSDLVLNTNLHAEELRPRCEQLNPDVRFLFGARFALLRREFTRLAGISRPSRPALRHLLVTFGGVDPAGATIRVIDALETLQAHAWIIRIIVGGANPRIEEIRKKVARSSLQMELRVDVTDMTAEYRWSDAVISAGGSSCHEWLFFNLPAWVVSIAPNQDPILRALGLQELACTAGKIEDHGDPVRLGAALSSWLEDPRSPSQHAVDGWGAARVACEIAESPCWIRPVSQNSDRDFKFLHELANEPSVRSAGYHNDLIPWQDHLEWLKLQLSNPASRLWLVMTRNDEMVGLVRFHQQLDGRWEIGISLHPHHRSAGIARNALRIAMFCHTRALGSASWLATIRPTNLSSIRLFESLGFQLDLRNRESGEWRLQTIASL